MEHSIYLRGLKSALKARGLTYAELARDLRMTESGIKKMLNAKDISFRRVLQICEVLQVLPGEIFSLSERTGIPTIVLGRAQEEALLEDRKLLAVYWRFAVERLDPVAIARAQELPPARVKSLLQRLVTLGLLVRRRGNFRPKHEGRFRWRDDSKLARTLNREWSASTLTRALATPDQAGTRHRLVAMNLSPRSYADLVARLMASLDEAVQTSEREELTLRDDQLIRFSALVACVQKGVLD